MRKGKFILLFFLTFVFSLKITYLKANAGFEIINNLNNIETLKFDFIQVSMDKTEKGNCFLKRPHFLKCIYHDNKNKKELIINKNNLVIHHKRYNKTYYYPASYSFFLEILDKKKFKNMILKGKINLENETYEAKYFMEKKGEITFFFDKNNLDLTGWEIIDLNRNITNFKIINLVKNEELGKKIFQIPKIN